jgi:hypothetical protein
VKQLERKGVRGMRYEKPMIVTLVPAATAIEANVKDPSHVIDASFEMTIGAYEADE